MSSEKSPSLKMMVSQGSGLVEIADTCRNAATHHPSFWVSGAMVISFFSFSTRGISSCFTAATTIALQAM